jgi:hypothetical protein
MKQFLTCVVMVGLLCGVSSAALIIDPFSEVDTNITANVGTPSATDTDVHATILGGQRKATVDYTVGISDVRARLVDAIPPFGGSNNAISLSSDSGTTGDWTLEWGSGGAGGTDLGDLTQGGTLDRIIVKVLFNDLVIPIDLTLDDGTNSATVTKFTTGGPGNLEYLFSDFVGVDATSANSLVLMGTGVQDVDLTIDLISADIIPEPATMALLGMAVVGLGGYIRKRRHA